MTQAVASAPTEKPKAFDPIAYLKTHLMREKNEEIQIKSIDGVTFRINWWLPQETTMPGLIDKKIIRSRMVFVNEVNGIKDYEKQ